MLYMILLIEDTIFFWIHATQVLNIVEVLRNKNEIIDSEAVLPFDKYFDKFCVDFTIFVSLFASFWSYVTVLFVNDHSEDKLAPQMKINQAVYPRGKKSNLFSCGCVFLWK